MVPGALKYQRILLKLSGEVLNGGTPHPLDQDAMSHIVSEIAKTADLGVQIAVVIGGGNFFRGIDLVSNGIDRITGDQMGMLATLINALALRDFLERCNKLVRLVSALPIDSFFSPFERHKAISYLDKGYIVVFAGGTGNPLVSTDSAASLRGIEIKADLLLKATHVDGIYSGDPKKDSRATLYSHIDYQQALQERLQIMDSVAFSQCCEHDLPIRVFNIRLKNALSGIVQGKAIGTLVSRRN